MIGSLQDQLAVAKGAEGGVGRERDELAFALASEQARLAGERRRGAGLEARIAAFEAERVDRAALLDRQAQEIRALEAEIAAQAMQRDALAAEVARLEAERAGLFAELERRAERDRRPCHGPRRVRAPSAPSSRSASRRPRKRQPPAGRNAVRPCRE